MVQRVIVKIKPPSRWPRNYIVDALKSAKLPSTRYIESSRSIDRDDNIEVLVSNVVTREDLGNLSRLRYIIVPTSGTEGIDLDEVQQRGINIIQDKKITAEGVVDYTYNQLEAFSDGNIKRFFKGKTIGLLGFGNVGQGIYERLISNKCSWYIIREREHHPDDGQKAIKYFNLNSIDKVIKKSDILINALPLNKHTKGVMLEKTHMIKKGALIVNISRTGILNEKEVLQGVLDGYFSGAIFDVYSKDINPNDYSHPKIVLTPHIAGIYGSSLNRMTCFIKKNIELLLTR